MMSFIRRVLSIALLLQFYSQFAWASVCYETLDCGGMIKSSTASLPNGEPRCCIEGFGAYQGSGVEGCVPCRATPPPPTTMASTSAVTTTAASMTTAASTTAQPSDTKGMPTALAQPGNVGESLRGSVDASCQAGCIAGIVVGSVIGMVVIVGGTAAIIGVAFHVIAKK